MWWFRSRSLGTGEWHQDVEHCGVSTVRESTSKKSVCHQETHDTATVRDSPPTSILSEEDANFFVPRDETNDDDGDDASSLSTNVLLGGERHLLDPSIERQGVLEMIQSLSDDEKEQILDSRMYIRHLRAEKGDVNKAIETLRAALQWRREFGVHDLLAALPPKASSSSPPNDNHTVGQKNETQAQQNLLAQALRFENSAGKVYVRGYDRQGRALIYMRPARENSTNERNQMRHLVWNIEKAIAVTAKKSKELTGVALEKYNLVIDYDGFKLMNAPPLSTSKYTLDILQKHYPERMYRAYLIHPPAVFNIFWKLVRPFIDPVTKEKVVFCTGKHGLQKFTDAVAPFVHKLEKDCGGPGPVREFDSAEYLNLPFDVSFDET